MAVDVTKIDARWLDTLYDIFDKSKKWTYLHREVLMIINSLETSKSKKFDKLLLSLLSKLNPNEITQVFRLLVHRETENRYEEIYTSMVKIHTTIKSGSNNYYYEFRNLNNSDFWNKFPKSYAEKFRKLHVNDKTEIFETIATEIETANN